MRAVPAISPDTTPPVDTLAVAGALLLQAPVPVALVSVVVNPTQTVRSPAIVSGSGLTVTVRTVLDVHPIGFDTVSVTTCVPGRVNVWATEYPVPEALLPNDQAQTEGAE